MGLPNQKISLAELCELKTPEIPTSPPMKICIRKKFCEKKPTFLEGIPVKKNAFLEEIKVKNTEIFPVSQITNSSIKEINEKLRQRYWVEKSGFDTEVSITQGKRVGSVGKISKSEGFSLLSSRKSSKVAIRHHDISKFMRQSKVVSISRMQVTGKKAYY